MSFEFTPIDNDLLLAGIDGYVKSESTNYYPIYPLKAGEKRKVYFVTDCWSNDGSWVNYRAVAAFEGLRGGWELPNGLKEFIVNDEKIVVDATGQKKRMRVKGQDKILDLVKPSTRYPTKDGLPAVNSKTAMNVVDEEGNHIILTMSAARGRELISQMENWRAVNDNFTATKYPFVLQIVGQSPQYELSITPMTKEAPIELPEPFNVIDVLVDIRKQVEEYVASLSSNTSVNDWSEVADEEDAVVESFESSVAATPSVADYDGMSDARLKALLTKAGVAVPPRSTRAALVELANTNL